MKDVLNDLDDLKTKNPKLTSDYEQASNIKESLKPITNELKKWHTAFNNSNHLD